MRFGRLFMAMVLVLALAAAGCASGSSSTDANTAGEPQTERAESASSDDPATDDPTTSGTSDSETTSSAAADQSDADDDSINDQFISPVFEALGFDPNDRQAVEDEYTAAAEELIRKCMAEAGFDYLPNIPSFAPSFARQLELNETISREQFTTEYGFGISTLTELDFREEGVSAFVEVLLGSAPDEARSDGEQAAYEMALSGRTIQGLSAEEAQQQAFDNPFQAEPGSCRAYGYDTADNATSEKFDGLYALLGDEFTAIQEDVENDPRIRELRAQWQTCMAGHGYSYERVENILNEIFEADQDLRNRFQTSPEALTLFGAAADDDLAGMNSEDRFDWLESNGAFQGFSMVPELQAELDELIEFELTVAGHSAECSDDDTFVAVQLEYEEAFVQAHAEQLELIASGEA